MLVLISILAFLLQCDGKLVFDRSFPFKAPALLYAQSGSLFVASFGPFSAGSLSRINNLASPNPTPTLLTDKLTWPNALEFYKDSILVADGFLVPLKNPGAVFSFNLSTSTLTELAKGAGHVYGPFYTMTQVLNDGTILAGKCEDVVFSKLSLLVLLSFSGGSWTETPLFPGIDFAFDTLYDPKTGITTVVGGSWAYETMSIFTYKAGKVLKQRTFDSKIGPVFSVQFVDLNADNKIDILVTTSDAAPGGSILAYEIPKDPFSGNFTKHVLASGFPVPSGEGKAAPGGAQVLPAPTGARPPIFLAGDDNGELYYLDPVADFNYTISTITTFVGTVGRPSLDSQKNKLYVPDYNGDKIVVFDIVP